MERDGSAQATTHAISRHLADQIGRHAYDMWFGDTAQLRVRDTRVQVAAPSRFVADWINGHFREALDGAARAALGASARVEVHVAPGGRAAADGAGNGGHGPPGGPGCAANGTGNGAAPHGRGGTRPRHASGLRRLDDFVVGSSNKLAHDAAHRMAGAEAEGATRLFLHGECGVGKTHLLQGIARRVGTRRTAGGPASVRYLTAEQFTNEYINAVRGSSIDRFRRRTRRLELMAIDDVHFLANKAATQSEFMHTIDAIDLAGGRLVLASDEHPRRLGFGQALGSRFVAGMVARIERPDPATRITLIHKLAARHGLTLSTAAAETIAGRCPGSVRELEGAVNKLAALRVVSGASDGSEVGLVGVEQVFRDASWRPRTPLRIDTVVNVVCDQMAVSRADLLGSGRHRRVVTARGLVSWLARELTTMSYPEIAHALGRKHHSTVHTAASRIAGQLQRHERVELGAAGASVRLDELVDQLRHAVIRAAAK